MNERTLCALFKMNDRECSGDVPPDAPVELCGRHLQKAYLYVRDLVEAYEPPPPDEKPGRQLAPTIVYYIRFGERIKIGTTGDLWARVKQIPCDRLLATEPGGFDVERSRHEQFKAFRLNANAEWFRDCPEIRRHVNALRQQYGDPVEGRYPKSVKAALLEGDVPWER